MNPNLLYFAIQIIATLVAVATLIWRLNSAQEKRLIKHLDDRFQIESESRQHSDDHIRELMNRIESDNDALENRFDKVQRELLTLKADLPEKYVRRDDYVRGQTLIESKLDALALRLQNWQLRGDPRD